MSAPALLSIDHIHVYVRNRAQAVLWYQEVLGLSPLAEFAAWAEDGGPLTISNPQQSLALALFERAPQACRSTIAFAVSAAAFAEWRAHLAQKLGSAPTVEDHALSWSLYFSDPDGNPYEITTYEYAAARDLLQA